MDPSRKPLQCTVSLLFAVSLTGCVTDAAEPARIDQVAVVAPTVTPSQARSSILGMRDHLWKDPHSIRDARIGAPAACPYEQYAAAGGLMGGIAKKSEPATCVCIEANAKNSMGGYTGMHRTIFVFRANGETTTKDGGEIGFPQYCGNAVPFPEFNGR